MKTSNFCRVSYSRVRNSSHRRVDYTLPHLRFFFFLVISLYPGIYHINWLDKDCPSTISTIVKRPVQVKEKTKEDYSTLKP